MANLGYPWFLDIFLVFRNFKTHLAFQDPWFLVDVSCGADRTVEQCIKSKKYNDDIRKTLFGPGERDFDSILLCLF